jgi:hypothetical protein
MLLQRQHVSTQADGGVLRLLPAFDGLWLGYRDHDLFLEPEKRARVFPGGGMLRPFIFGDGHIVGTWARRTTGRGLDVSVESFEHVDEQALGASLGDLERITERSVRLLKR